MSEEVRKETPKKEKRNRRSVSFKVEKRIIVELLEGGLIMVDGKVFTDGDHASKSVADKLGAA